MSDLLTKDDLLLLEKTLWHTDMTLGEALDVIGLDQDHFSEEEMELLTERLADMGVVFCSETSCWVSN